MEYVLTTSALTKRYGRDKALDRLSMHVPKGAIYGFIGKNGAGKTTLIRVICGLQKLTEGTYQLYGTDSKDKQMTKVRRRMSAIVEKPSIYMDMTAEENMRMQYRMLGLPSDDGISEILEIVGLSDTGKKKAAKFSLGMKQRLGIAIALAGNPDLLVLDEPTNGLDPEGIIEIRELILKLNREHQITVLISSHMLDELAKIATHYGFIDKGHMVKEVSAQELDKLCRKCMQVEVTDTRILSCELDKMGVDYEILSEHIAYIYAGLNITQLVLALVKQDCEVISVNVQDESLESYFIKLLGGDEHE